MLPAVPAPGGDRTLLAHQEPEALVGDHVDPGSRGKSRLPGAGDPHHVFGPARAEPPDPVVESQLLPLLRFQRGPRRGRLPARAPSFRRGGRVPEVGESVKVGKTFPQVAVSVSAEQIFLLRGKDIGSGKTKKLARCAKGLSSKFRISSVTNSDFAV